jgi:predicted DsbA family dithiol-disulfide isomerase
MEGMALADLFRGRGFDLEGAHRRLAELMKAEGLPFAQRDRISNSRLAQELATWAAANGKPGIHDALYRKYFVDGADLSTRDVLLEAASSVGLPADEASRVLDERSFGDAVDRDWERAADLGITGVPTFVANGRGVVGAQPYEVLERLVIAAGAKRREG